MDIRRIHSEGLRVVVVGQVEDSFLRLARVACEDLRRQESIARNHHTALPGPLWRSPSTSKRGGHVFVLIGPPEPQNIGKTLCLATFLRLRAPASSFFSLSLTFSFDFLLRLFPCLLFMCPYCRKFDF